MEGGKVVKMRNNLATSVDVWVIKEVVTTLAPNEEKEVAVGADERIKIKLTPTP